MTRLGDLFLIPEWTASERENVARLLSRIESIALDLGSRIDAQGNATELRAGAVRLGPVGLVVTVGGVEKLRVDDGGLILGNNLSTIIRFKAADGGASATEGMRIASNTSDYLDITNREPGKGINLYIHTTAEVTQGLVWREDPALAERPQLNLGVGSQGTKLTIGGEVEIHGGAGGVTTVFNEQGRDIDFRVEGDTATSLLVADAGLDAVQVGTTVAGAIADFRAATIVFNEAGADLDFRVEGDTNANVFNVDAGKDVAYFRGIGARVRHSVDQSVPSATSTVIAFDTEDFDTDTIHNTVTNNGRLTATTAGVYSIVGHVRWTGAGGVVRYLLLRFNGATYIATSRVANITDGAIVDHGVATTYNMAAGDYIELQGYQDSGAGLNVQAGANFSPVFSMVKMG